MRHRALVLGVVLGLCIHQRAHAQNAQPPALSLADAKLRFERENLRLAAARLEVRAVRAEVLAAGLLPNPRLSLAATLHVHGASDGAAREYQVGVAQELPIWGRLSAAREAAKLGASVSERELLALGWAELCELRRAYLELQLAMARREALDAGLRDLESVERVLQARAAAGANPVYDRQRLLLERSSLRARRSQAVSAIAAASAGLSHAIGGAEARAYLASDALPEPTTLSPESVKLIQNAFARRPDLQASRLEVDAARARLRATERRYLPEPELGVGYARYSAIAGLPETRTGGAILAQASLPLPLFDHGQGSIDGQAERARAARARDVDLQKAVAREITFAAEQVRLTASAYATYREEAVAQADSVRKIAEVTYREGRGTILELLDAYASQLRVAEQALELRHDALMAELTLERAVGPR